MVGKDVQNLSTDKICKMKIWANTSNPEDVPKVGDNFTVTNVEDFATFWMVELKKKC